MSYFPEFCFLLELYKHLKEKGPYINCFLMLKNVVYKKSWVIGTLKKVKHGFFRDINMLHMYIKIL